jgi:Tfp pilus assembly protein PilX
MKKQQGMATLIVVIVVLVITTLMVFFATKVGLFDQRMAGNEVRYKEAFTTAEAGLDMAVQKFKDQWYATGTAPWATIMANSAIASGTSSNGTVAGAGTPSFGVTIGPGRSIPAGSFVKDMTYIINNIGTTDFTLIGASGNVVGTPFTATGVGTGTGTAYFSYQFISTSLGADGTGTATVSREITMKSILGGSGPSVPVVVAGTVGAGGDFNIVANPNGGGNGIPVSIWTGGPSPTGDVSMGGSSATCHIQYFDGNNPQCSNPSGNSELISQGSSGLTLSAYSAVAPDVVPNDPNFPADLFQFLFGVSRTDWQSVYGMANSRHQVVADCSSLSATSGQKFRLWWITGDCSMGSNQVIGSEANPVILVIDDHQLIMGGAGSRIYGVPFLFNNPSNAATPSAVFHGSPAIYGSFISDMGGAAMNGSYSIVYDQTLLNNLVSTTSSANFSIAYIPGSWRDF